MHWRADSRAAMPRTSYKRRCCGRADPSRRSGTRKRADRIRKDIREPTEVSLDDADGFSLYRTLVDEDPFPYSDTLHLDFLGGFSEDDIHTVLQRLPARYRAPLLLRYMEGFPTKQIARLLELPLGTVLSQLHRGRKLFERALWDYAIESGAIKGTAARREDAPWTG
jgi:RNA polymerase sigma-70 factor, ECF subfamily